MCVACSALGNYGMRSFQCSVVKCGGVYLYVSNYDKASFDLSLFLILAVVIWCCHGDVWRCWDESVVMVMNFHAISLLFFVQYDYVM